MWCEDDGIGKSFFGTCLVHGYVIEKSHHGVDNSLEISNMWNKLKRRRERE